MPESQDKSAAILEPAPDPAAPPPRKSRRFWFRFTLTLFGLMTVAIIWSGWYVYSKGFTKRWRNFLSAELRRYGLDVTVRRITLDPFEGLVAHDVVLKRADRDGGPVLTISRTALDINLAQLFQRETFLNSIDLRDARAIIPVDAREPNGPRFEVKNLRAKILFPPGHIRLTLAEGDVEGIHFSASGLVASSGDTPPFLRDDAITGEALESRRKLARALLDELKKLKFGGEPPRVVVEFAGDLAKPDTLQATARLTAAGVQRGTYQLKSLQLLARFEDGLIKLENGEISDARGRLNAQGDFRPATGAASGRVRSDLDLTSALAEFWPGALNYGLSSREPPKVEFSLRARVPGANPPPDLPGTDAIPDFEIVGRLESGSLTARGIAFEGLKTEFSWRDGHWYLRGGRLVHRSGELVADVMNAAGEFKAKVVSTIDPDVLAPLLMRPGRNLLNEMSFQDSPRIELTAEGKSITDFASMQARGRVEVSKTKFRGVPLLKASCDVEIKNQALSFRRIMVDRDEGRVTADAITYDFGRFELRIDNGRSNCIPNDVMMWIDPNWMKFVRPYRWKRPPAVKVDGVVQFHGRMNTKLTIDFDAPAGMDYTFAKRALVITKFSGQLLFTEHRLQLNNLRGELFDGRWRASADIPVNRPGVAYSAKVETEESDFQAFAKTYFGFGDTHGRMNARYDFTGRGGDPSTLVGSGTAKVEKGNVFAIPVFGPLSSVLGKAAPGLGYDKANQASADYTTKDGRVETKNFLVKGAGFSMFGSGWVNYLNDKMDFRVRVNAQGLPGVVLYAVSKLFEFHTDGPFSDPVWKPMMGTVPGPDQSKPGADATKPVPPTTPPPRPVPTPPPTPAGAAKSR